jgi:two-component system sensor histidine kinase YesM
MEKLKKHIANLPVKYKILFIIAFNIVAFTIVSLAGMQIVTRANNCLLYQSTASSLSDSATNLSKDLDYITRLSSIMISDSQIQNDLMLVKHPDNAIKRKNAYQSLYDIVQTYFQQFKQNHLSYISLYNDSFSTHTYATEEESVPDEVIRDLIKTGKESNGSPIWVTKYSNRYGLFLVRSVRQIHKLSLQQLGVLVICVEPDEMVKSATNYGNQYKSASYLLFDSNEPIYYTNSFSDKQAELIQEELDTPYAVISLNKTSYFAVKGFIPNQHWEYVSLVDYNSIYHSVQASQTLFIVTIILCALLSMILSNLLVRSLTWHFGNLIRKMKAFSQNGAKLEKSSYDYRDRKDEFGVLYRQFDSMARQIEHLIETNYTNEILCKDAQIKALETEINPHFLYNTLESINWRAKAIGEKQISQMVEALGRLMRFTLNDNSDSTLRQELDLANCYMTIQKIRFEDRLDFRIENNQKLLNASLPKLTIQPLVENAIHYGLEENTGDCRISVDMRLEGEDLLILVRNDGSQFEDRLLEKLENGTAKPRGMGIGLLNIQKRLQLSFGTSYGLSVYNEGSTAVAEIHVPYSPI